MTQAPREGTDKLSAAQQEYLAFGPYPQWGSTRRALHRRGLVDQAGQFTPAGIEARRKLKAMEDDQ